MGDITKIDENSGATAKLTDRYGGVTEADEEFINRIGRGKYVKDFGKDENITDAEFVEDHMLISENMEFAVYVSEN